MQLDPPTQEFLITKLISGISGLLGALCIAVFWLPERLKRYGSLAAGAIIGGVSVGSAFSLGGLIATIAGMDTASLDVALGIGWVIGALSMGVLNFLANFFSKRHEEDIAQIVKELLRRDK